MKLIATYAVRNEDWVVGCSLRTVLRWCDEAVVLLHCCTDRTPEIVAEIAAEHPGRVHVLGEINPVWAEMDQRQRMLTEARRHGATHIAVTDADEVLTGNMLPVIRDQIKQLPPGGYLTVGMPCMWRSLTQYRTGSSIWANRSDLMLAFCDSPRLSWQKVNGYDHHHRHPLGSRRAIGMSHGNGGVMHLQFAPWRRLVAKHALYKVSERLKYPGKSIAEIDRMYSLALDEGGLQLAQAPLSWWEPYADLMQNIDLNAEPWQEAAVQRQFNEHGPGMFAGLNLFGVEKACALAA